MRFFLFGTFGTVSLPHKTQSKTGQTGAINAKVRVNFRNKRSRSIPLDPKLMFWCVPFHLGAFGTVSLLHKTRFKMGQPVAINAKVRATKSRQNFSKPTHPIHTIGPWAQVSMHFFSFGCIWDHYATAQTWCKTRQTGAINAKVRATMSC